MCSVFLSSHSHIMFVTNVWDVCSLFTCDLTVNTCRFHGDLSGCFHVSRGRSEKYHLFIVIKVPSDPIKPNFILKMDVLWLSIIITAVPPSLRQISDSLWSVVMNRPVCRHGPVLTHSRSSLRTACQSLHPNVETACWQCSQRSAWFVFHMSLILQHCHAKLLMLQLNCSLTPGRVQTCWINDSGGSVLCYLRGKLKLFPHVSAQSEA